MDRKQEFICRMPLENTEELADKLEKMGFFDAPASTRFHGAYDGGLFDHSLAVTEALVELTEKLNLKWERPESPYIVGMLHDICKCDQYIKGLDGIYRYNSFAPKGHGDRSVSIVRKLMDITDEEALCIRWHMGAYEGSEIWNDLGKAIEKCPNVLYTHTADMIASRIKGV